MVFKFKTTGLARTREGTIKFRNRADIEIAKRREKSLRWSWCKETQKTKSVIKKEYKLIYQLPNKAPSIKRWVWNYETKKYEDTVNPAGIVEIPNKPRKNKQQVHNFVLYWDGKVWWVAHEIEVVTQKLTSNWHHLMWRSYWNEENEQRWYKRNNFHWTRPSFGHRGRDWDDYYGRKYPILAKEILKADLIDFNEWIYNDDHELDAVWYYPLECTWEIEDTWMWGMVD